MKEIQFVILNNFADWESATLAAALNQVDDFIVKTVSLTHESVKSIGGFTVLPDYDIEEAFNKDCAALILIGGMSWRTPEAKQVEKLVTRAMERKVVVAGICDATAFLGAMGALNKVEHTGNQLENLQQFAGSNYTNAAHYLRMQAVRCENVITANGSAQFEFAREVLLALDAMPKNVVEQNYAFWKNGYFPK